MGNPLISNIERI
ncbi:hypothetical protein F383_30447 [Gossypium arboreum]|uniref:Uncharacterized protein n=1 Tax=Gossypium arboreum TaxID=29729 RepID=A0A0B0M6N8_GOSAR|nr:hypothetical protein F383_37179 [Gossypium arboreum]KHG05605.1 hypothetical protein F383_30447 [Gossypium arboreum]